MHVCVCVCILSPFIDNSRMPFTYAIRVLHAMGWIHYIAIGNYLISNCITHVDTHV